MAWLRHSVTVAPAEEPITISDVKAHTRITDTADDVSLNAFIRGARSTIESRCGAKLITQTCKLVCNNWLDLRRFPIYPLQSITAITYLDENQVEQTLDPTVYSVTTGREPTIYLNSGKSWPAIYNAYSENWTGIPHFGYPTSSTARDAIRVTGVFGFGSSAQVPDDIKLAMYLLIGGWNENRESLGSHYLVELPQGVQSLLADYQSYA
jgi:hypothetical protein